jgi:hypothetical protein
LFSYAALYVGVRGKKLLTFHEVEQVPHHACGLSLLHLWFVPYIIIHTLFFLSFFYCIVYWSTIYNNNKNTRHKFLTFHVRDLATRWIIPNENRENFPLEIFSWSIKNIRSCWRCWWNFLNLMGNIDCSMIQIMLRHDFYTLSIKQLKFFFTVNFHIKNQLFPFQEKKFKTSKNLFNYIRQLKSVR